MPIYYFEAPNPAYFGACYAAAYAKALQLTAPLFIHVRGTWCHDCQETDDGIRWAFENRKQSAVLLTVQVVDPLAYAAPTYSYRTDPLLMVTAIPTLLEVGGSRLVEHQCYDTEYVKVFVGAD